MKNFLIRKFKNSVETLLILLIMLPISAISIALMALPGVAIAFLAFGADSEALVVGGLLSYIVIAIIVIATSKIKKLIKEYKNFDSKEEC